MSKPKEIKEGSVWSSNSFGDFRIVKKTNSMNIYIEFIDTGFAVKVQASQVRNGNIKDLLMPSVCGVGFIGRGKHKSRGSKLEVNLYTVWVNMIYRCYSSELNRLHPSYDECTVSKDWHNYQNFADWFYSLGINNLDGLFLDKDLKNPNNKEYSKDSCIFVSRCVNNFTTSRDSLRGSLMLGVSMPRGCVSYIARCWNPETKTRERLGAFKTEIDAHMAWRHAKSKGALYLSSIQENPEVRAAILNWKEALDCGLIHQY